MVPRTSLCSFIFSYLPKYLGASLQSLCPYFLYVTADIIQPIHFGLSTSRWLGKTDGKMNEAVCMKNRITLDGGGERQVQKFKRQEFCKCIGCILLAVTYGKKGRKLWSEVPKGFCKY